MTQLGTRPGEKTAHWGRGCMYQTSNGAWRCEWSSGERRASGRMKYHVACLHGSYAASRKLLDLIVSKPHRSKEDAMALIAPYLKTTKLMGQSPVREIIEVSIPPSPSGRHVARRERIQLDYWRMRLLDTMEAYRRFDDA